MESRGSITLEKACSILDISWKESNYFEAVRTAYRDKMRISTQNRSKRIELNAAYQFLYRRLFKTVEPESELVHLIMIG